MALARTILVSALSARLGGNGFLVFSAFSETTGNEKRKHQHVQESH